MSLHFSAAGTFSFEAEELTVTEGVNATVSPRLVIDSVPEGGVQGIIEIELFVSSSGASKLILSHNVSFLN